MSEEKAKTSLGLEPNVEALLCYVLGWVTGLIFFLLEKENQFVRFHALQSIITFGAINVVIIALSILSIIPFLGILFAIINWLIGVLGFVLWIVLMVKAYQGQMYKLPWAGKLAEQQLQPKA
jgi:uncharacterized membrane protein